MSAPAVDGDAADRTVYLQTGPSSALAELWKPVPGFEGWTDASSLGRIRRWYVPQRGRVPRGGSVKMLDAPVLVKPASGGLYVSVAMRNAAGAQKPTAWHHAVLTAFCGLRRRGAIACHFPDANIANCSISNIRWDDYDANLADEIAHRTRDPRVVLARLLMLREHFPHLRSDVDGISYVRRVGRLESAV